MVSGVSVQVSAFWPLAARFLLLAGTSDPKPVGRASAPAGQRSAQRPTLLLARRQRPEPLNP